MFIPSTLNFDFLSITVSKDRNIVKLSNGAKQKIKPGMIYLVRMYKESRRGY